MSLYSLVYCFWNAVINENIFVSQLLCRNGVFGTKLSYEIMSENNVSILLLGVWLFYFADGRHHFKRAYKRFVIVMFDQTRVRQSHETSLTHIHITKMMIIFLNCTRSDPLTGFHAYISFIIWAVFHFQRWQRRKNRTHREINSLAITKFIAYIFAIKRVSLQHWCTSLTHKQIWKRYRCMNNVHCTY